MSRIKVSNVEVPEDLARGEPSEEMVAQLACSLQGGQLQPIIVFKGGRGKYTLAAGLRRLRAAQLLEWETIEAKILTPVDVDGRLEVGNAMIYPISVIENLVRDEMTVREKAVAVFKLLSQFDMSPQDIVDLGIVDNTGTVRRYRLLAQDNPEILELIESTEGDDNEITEYHVRQTRGLKLDDLTRYKILAKANREGLTGDQVREVAAAASVAKEEEGNARMHHLIVDKPYNPTIHDAEREAERYEKRRRKAEERAAAKEEEDEMVGEVDYEEVEAQGEAMMKEVGVELEETEEAPETEESGFEVGVLQVWASRGIQGEIDFMLQRADHAEGDEEIRMHQYFFVPSWQAGAWLIMGLIQSDLLNEGIVWNAFGLREWEGEEFGWTEWEDEDGDQISDWVDRIILLDQPYKSQ